MVLRCHHFQGANKRQISLACLCRHKCGCGRQPENKISHCSCWKATYLIQATEACSMLSCLELPTDWQEDPYFGRMCVLQRCSLLCWVPQWIFWPRHPRREGASWGGTSPSRCLKSFPPYTSVSTVLSFLSHHVSLLSGPGACVGSSVLLMAVAWGTWLIPKAAMAPATLPLASDHPCPHCPALHRPWLLPWSRAHPKLPCWEGQDLLLGEQGQLSQHRLPQTQSWQCGTLPGPLWGQGLAALWVRRWENCSENLGGKGRALPCAWGHGWGAGQSWTIMAWFKPGGISLDCAHPLALFCPRCFSFCGYIRVYIAHS